MNKNVVVGMKSGKSFDLHEDADPEELIKKIAEDVEYNKSGREDVPIFTPFETWRNRLVSALPTEIEYVSWDVI